MRFVTYYRFERLEFIIRKYGVFMKLDKCLELYKYQSERGCAAVGVRWSYWIGDKALEIVAPKQPRTGIVKLDEEGNPIGSSSVSDVPASPLCASPSVIYPQIQRPDL